MTLTLFVILVLSTVTTTTGSLCAFLESMNIIPCKNGAECQPVGTSEFRCQCLDGYSGKLCQTDTDECASNPCVNGGTCIDGINSYNCSCPESFTGRNCETGSRCEVLRAYLSSGPCFNGGTCLDLENGHRCACPHNFSGVLCQEDAKRTDLQDQRKGDQTPDGKCKDHVCLLQKNYGFAIIGGIGHSNKVSYWNSSSSQTIDTEVNVPNSLVAHAATALLNDSVLVTGGYSFFTEETSSYSYTIELGYMKAEILSSGHIAGEKLNHGSVMLPDGRVLLCGGHYTTDEGNVYLDSCFTYNAGAWTRSAPMLTARSGRFGMASDGEYVYAVGGWLEGNNVTNTAERYNPETNRWENMPSLLGPPVSHLSLVHVNRKLYAIGGNNGTLGTSLVQIYDISTGTWSLGPELNHPREEHSALATPDGSLWVFGGFSLPKTLEVLPAGAEHWSLVSNVLPRDVTMAQVLWVNKTITGSSAIDMDTGDNGGYNYDYENYQ